MRTSHILLEVRQDAKSLAEYTFSGTRITVGRSPEADVQLSAREVSRRHAVVLSGPDGFTVEDLSLNGVERAAASGVETSGCKLTYPYGAHFYVGPYTLVVRQCADAAKDALGRDLRRSALDALVAQMGMGAAGDREHLTPRVEGALERILFDLGVTDRETRAGLRTELCNEALGLGPLESLLADDAVTEIMVVSHDAIYVEEKGCIVKTGLVFSSEDSVRTVIDRIIAPLGRRVDESSPMVDARLPDGSRVNAVIPPLALRGSAITIRKFSKTPLGMNDLVSFGTVNDEMAALLGRAVSARQNIVISGGTGSGKTTLLNILSSHIGNDERIVTIEDAAELRLNQPHVVSLESRPKGPEGSGEVGIRDLVKNALRMRPDRIVVGECRGAEALDMLQAMNTGHDGSLTTTHANSPPEAIARLETLSLMAGLNLPSRAIREQIAGAVDLVVQQSRFADGTRRVTAISEVTGMDEAGRVQLVEVFGYRRKGGGDGAGFVSTGWLPSFDLAGAR